MIKSKKSNLTPNKSEVDIPKSSIGFGAFEFFKNIARKYGIFRKTGNLPALIFLRLKGKRAEIKSVKPYCVISANNYFTFHLSFYFKIIRQLMKLPCNRYQPSSNSIYCGEQHLTSLSVPYPMENTGSVNYDSEPFLQERSLIFLKMPGIKNEPNSVRQVFKVHHSSREVFSGSSTRTFLRDTDFISQLNYLNSFCQIIPNAGTSSQERSGILPLKQKGSDEDLFRTISPVKRDTGRFSLVTYPSHRSITLDRDTIITLNPQNTAVSFLWKNFNIGGSTSQGTVKQPTMKKLNERRQTESSHISVYPADNAAFPYPVRFSHFGHNKYVQNMYYGNSSRETAASYFPFQRPLNRETIITLNPQNTTASYLWRNFDIGGSIRQRTAIAPAEQNNKELQHTEYPHISVYNVVNTAFHRLVSFSPFHKERVVKDTYHGSFARTKELLMHETFMRAYHPPILNNRIMQGISNLKVLPGTGFFSHLIIRQTNLTLEHQNTVVGYLTERESPSGSSPSGQALDARNILYKNKSATDEAIFPFSNINTDMPEITLSHSNPMLVAIQPRTLIAGNGGSIHNVTALQDGRQTSDQKPQPYHETVSGTSGFTMDDSVNIPFSHPGARQVNEVQKSVGAPVINLQRPVNAGKTGPEYSMNIASGIRHSSSGGQYSGFEENSGVSLKQSTLPFQYNTNLQNRHLRNIRNMLVGWKNSNLTMSTQKRSITMIPVNPVPENIYFRESTNSGYNDAVKSKMNPLFAVKGISPRNSAELILKKNTVQRTGRGVENKDNIQSERTASTKTNDTLNKESIKQRPAQELRDRKSVV